LPASIGAAPEWPMIVRSLNVLNDNVQGHEANKL
jgi:hypothetical protein